MKKTAGFTLIELIMVIVILGVLSAFALPRFADLGGDARISSLNALSGALKSAANISHAQQMADGTTGDTSISLEGQTITMASGYPTADTNGIVTAAQAGADYTTSDVSAGGLTILQFDFPTSRTDCHVQYEEADGTTNVTAVVTVETSGCN